MPGISWGLGDEEAEDLRLRGLTPPSSVFFFPNRDVRGMGNQRKENDDPRFHGAFPHVRARLRRQVELVCSSICSE